MKAFSYIRWSSDQQSQGDSLRRQLEKATAYADKHSLVLDTATYQDHGISAFTGANLIEGKLGAFLKAIDEGHIKTPCYLLVEALDRITREEIDIALELCMSITRRGVTIVTLHNEQTFSKESIKKDRGVSLIIMIAMLVQSHEDSSKRIERVRQAYQNLRAQGIKKITKIPTWLLPNPDRKTFRIDHEIAKLVNRIFDYAIKGYGQREVAVILNKEKIPTLHVYRKKRDNVKLRKKSDEARVKAKDSRRVWDQGAVSNVLGNHAVYGRKHHTNDEDYWPPIMSKDKFMTALDATKGRTWKGANREGIPNLFAGLAFCAVCGTRMRLIPTGNGYYYMKCFRAVDLKTCRGKLYPYAACELAFIYTMSRKTGLDISGEYLIDKSSQAPALRGEIDHLKDRQKKLVQLVALAPGVDAIADELNVLQKQVIFLEDQLEELDYHPLTRNEINRHQDLFDKYLKMTDDVLKKSDWNSHVDTSNKAQNDARRQIKVAMARLFKKIEFGVGDGGWEPLLFVTLADDTRSVVKVVDFLSYRSLNFQRMKIVKGPRKRK